MNHWLNKEGQLPWHNKLNWKSILGLRNTKPFRIYYLNMFTSSLDL